MQTESNTMDTYAVDSDMVLWGNSLQAWFQTCADQMQLLKMTLVLSA